MNIPKTFLAISFSAIAFISQAQADTFSVDKGKSSVLIDVKATGDSFTGKLNTYKITIQGDKDSQKPSKVAMNWNFVNLKTGKSKRDSKMISWLEKKTNGSFVLTSFTKRTDGRMWAKGKMTMHGVTRDIEFPAKVIAKNGRMTVRGTAVVDTRKFKLPVIKMIGLFKVDPIVKIRFTFRGSLK